jgi:hypothetical protein
MLNLMEDHKIKLMNVFQDLLDHRDFGGRARNRVLRSLIKLCQSSSSGAYPDRIEATFNQLQLKTSISQWMWSVPASNGAFGDVYREPMIKQDDTAVVLAVKRVRVRSGAEYNLIDDTTKLIRTSKVITNLANRGKNTEMFI